jgi:single-stranded-DNA-specific exonuclease
MNTMALSPKLWQVASPAPPEHFARFPHLHPTIVQVLHNRGIKDPNEVAAFLTGDVGEANPFSLDDIGTAVTRLRQALRAGEPIAVYGDFDSDGVTATVLLVQTLRALGGDVRAYIPNRVDEGYGLHEQALTSLARDGVRVVITVDCGVRSLDETEFANRLGLDVIITDHHSAGDRLPKAVAVIDPKHSVNRYSSNSLAGVGVAYKLAQALLRVQRKVPVTPKGVRLEEEDLLDLVAIGTVADLAPLLGENRTLVHKGLARINRMERPGIEALCCRAGLKAGQVDAPAIGYVLGPRLNAAGRLDDAKLAYRLLETPYRAEAEQLAERLDQLNRERRQYTTETLAQAREMVLTELAEGKKQHLLFVAGPDFSPGVVGLVASRLLDEFYRPAVVVKVGEKDSRGSARSIQEFNITHALDACADILVHHGGHTLAAGFTVHTEKLSQLRERLQALAEETLARKELVPAIDVDTEIPLQEMNRQLWQELQQLSPFGRGNPYPLFISRHVRVQHQRSVGADGQHLKLALSEGQSTWDAIAFRQGEWAGKLGDRIDIVYHIEMNEWNGERRLQLNVQDIRPAGLDDNIAKLWLNQAEPDSREVG